MQSDCHCKSCCRKPGMVWNRTRIEQRYWRMNQEFKALQREMEREAEQVKTRVSPREGYGIRY